MTIGLVLAGGQSKRMKQDKANILWQGIPLWQHMVTLLKGAGCTIVFVSRNQRGFLQDVTPHKGPLGGLDALFCHEGARLEKEGVLVVPVDMPLLTPCLLKGLIEAGHKSKKQVAYYTFKEALAKPMLFPLWLDRGQGASLSSYLGTGGRSVQGFLSTLDRHLVACSEDLKGGFANLNYPQDLLSAQT